MDIIWIAEGPGGEQPDYELERGADGSLRLWANMEFWLTFNVESASSLRDALDAWIAEQPR